MARTPEHNYLRAWREFRGLTQARLAEAVDTTGAVISLLESGDRGLSDKWLRRLAPVLGTTPGHLLDVDPNEPSNDIMEIWATIPEERRQQVRAILETFRVPGEPAAAFKQARTARPVKPSKADKVLPMGAFRQKDGAASSDKAKKTAGGEDPQGI